jgi:hypothetical protein
MGNVEERFATAAKANVMSFRDRCAALSLAALLFATPASAAIKGDVFQSKGGDSPFFVWDATPVVVDLVNAKVSRDAALHGLEANSIDLLAEREPSLKGAKRLTVRVIYQKIGAVNPAYGTATLTGVEQVFDLSVDASTIVARHKALSKALAAGKVPSGVRIAMTGELPPL